MSHYPGRASAPPWQYSQLLGGEYIWDPRTDEIVMRTGQRLARPRQLPRDALRQASYEGPLSFQYAGSPPSDPTFSLSNRPAQAGQSRPSSSSTPRTGNPKSSRPPQAALGRMSISTGGPPGGAPGGGPGRPHAVQSSSLPRPIRRVQAIDPGGETQVIIQSPSRNQLARKEAVRQPDATGYRVNIASRAIIGNFFPTFKVQRNAKDFFQVGRIFLVLWLENPGSIVTGCAPGIMLNHRGERVFSKVRRFVVIREGPNYCYALPISTYGGQGVARSGVTKCDHVIIYTARAAPSAMPNEAPGRGESAMRPVPIRVIPRSSNQALDPMSRLNLARLTLVQHNNQVQNFGMVCEGSVSDLKRQFENVWGDSPVPEPRLLPGPAPDEESSDDGAAEQGEDGEEDDDDDDDDDSANGE